MSCPSRQFCRVWRLIRMKAFRPNSGKESVGNAFRQLRPMLATVTSFPDKPRQYAYEYNRDGARTLCYHDGSNICFRSGNGIESPEKYPELGDLGRFLRTRRVILDGHIVVLDESGNPNASLLRQRLRAGKPSFSLVEEAPVRFIVCDVLFDRGRWTMNTPLEERAKRLESLKLNGLFWRTTERQIGNGQAMLHAAREKKLPGIIAKHLISTYQPGQKSADWLQIS
jgi:bifunctional non-homologous end joining protein LigD